MSDQPMEPAAEPILAKPAPVCDATSAGPLSPPVLFDVLMKNIPDLIYFKDLQSRFVAVSSEFARLSGLQSVDEVIGKSDFDFFPAEQAQRFYDDEQRIIATGQPVLCQQEHPTWRNPSGTYCSTTKLPLRDANGAIIGTFGIGRDITDLKRVEAELAESLALVNQQNEAMRKDLERARIIQRALLTEAPPPHPRLQLALRSRPMDAIGGDYFSFLPLAQEGLGLFIGDLAGHGVSAALFMTLVKFLVDHLGERLGSDPKSLLEELNRELIDRMPSSFLTALYGCFEPQRGGVRLRLGAAGHPPALVRRRQQRHIECIAAQSNGALGLFGEYDTQPVTLDLEPGDRVLFYTDGVTETANPEDLFLGEHGLIRLLGEAGGGSIDDVLDNVLEGIDGWRGSAAIADDLVLVGVEVR